ncbi:MAG TPA: stage II sporulation protein M [Candidatus Acidoferrales bacterium]|nr:stage II sporulation protein M [Candidatus Acidoferrales bacterium]
MILDLERFQAQERPHWSQLESLLAQLEGRPDRRLKPAEAELLQDLYARTAADLNRVTHGALAPELRQYLERLVARAYAELYYARPTRSELWRPRRWLRIFTAFPEAFRRQSRCFALAVLVTILGCAMGGLAVRYDPAAVDVLLPADYLRNPSLRVHQEEQGKNRRLDSTQVEAMFSAQLITHNIQVALLAAALGVTFGIGTALLLFENGLLLGAVAVRYTQQGFGVFVTAWLLPHGAFEIPSILIAGQAGFYLARLLLHRREDRNMRQSIREWLLLIAGLALMLVWAGLMEAFFSQHHAPVLPYGFKIAAGAAELVLLTLYLLLIGRRQEGAESAGHVLAAAESK